MSRWIRQCSPLFVALFVLRATPAAAQGVTLNDPSTFSASIGSGARALAMGGAFIAIADDATASSWNPAGLCVLEKAEASLVYQARRKSAFDFSPSESTYSEPGYRNPESDSASNIARSGHDVDFASITYPIRKGSWKFVPQISYQRAVPFGGTRTNAGLSYSGNEYYEEDGSSYNYTGTFHSDTDSSGGLDIYAGSLGVSFTNRLYLGASVNLWRKGSDSTRNALSASQYEGFGPNFLTTTEKAHQDFRGTNVNVGAIFKPTTKLRLGLVFKTPFTMTYTASDTFSSENQTGFSRRTIISEQGDIHWPRTIGAGIAVLPSDALSLSADFTTSRWSGATYAQTITTRRTNSRGLDQTTMDDRTVTYPGLSDTLQPEDGNNPFQNDSNQIRFGAEYVIRSPHIFHLAVLPLRVGAFTDRQIFKNKPGLGNVSFLGITGGFGLVWSHITLDFAYVHQSGSYRESEGRYSDGYFIRETHQARDDEFRSNKFYVSTIIRF